MRLKVRGDVPSNVKKQFMPAWFTWKRAIIGIIALTVVIRIGMGFVDTSPPDMSGWQVPREQIPEDENAFTWFVRAGDAVCLMPGTNGVDELWGQTNKVDWALAEAMLRTNAQVFSLIERGLQCDKCQYPSIANPFQSRPYSFVSLRALGRLMVLRSRFLSNRNTHDAAFLAEMDTVRFGRCLRREPGMLIDLLVAMAVQGMGFNVLNNTDLAGVSEEKLRSALTETERWVDEMQEGVRRTYKGEAVVSAKALDDVNLQNAGANWYFVEDWPSERMVKMAPSYFLHRNRTKRLLLDHYAKALAVADGRPFSSMGILDDVMLERKMPSKTAVFLLNLRSNALGLQFVKTTGGSTGRAVFKRVCANEAQISAFRLRVAARLFEEKKGRLPPSLSELVPEFIPAVPRDPFDGKPFRYVRDRRIIYSIGEDLQDQGGSDKKDPPYGMMGEDMVFSLSTNGKSGMSVREEEGR